MDLRKISVYLELMRAWNCMVVFVGIVVGAALVLRRFPYDIDVLVAAISGFLITGGGNALNDYFDREIDKINKPNRPIPSGRLSGEGAFAFSTVVFFMGLVLVYHVNIVCLDIALFNTAILLGYARYSKKMLLLANLEVAYLVSSVFLFGAFVVAVEGLKLTVSIGAPPYGFYGLLPIAIAQKRMIVVSICAFLVALSLEVTKDMEDVKGDSSAGALTLPIKIGEKWSKLVSVFSVLGAVILSPMPWILGLHAVYMILVIPADALFIASQIADPTRGRKMISLGMGLTVLALLLGAIL
jgi:geranylgeranylglycerol-phosphate geranylgeranyltransferase